MGVNRHDHEFQYHQIILLIQAKRYTIIFLLPHMQHVKQLHILLSLHLRIRVTPNYIQQSNIASALYQPHRNGVHVEIRDNTQSFLRRGHVVHFD